jgi:hypothetical protein
MRRQLVWLMFLLLCLSAITATAARTPVRDQIESSMLVTGTVDITTEGDVVAYALDQPDKLPKGIVDLTADLARQWKFESVALPADTISRSSMRLLYVAKKLGDGKYSIGLQSTYFGHPSPKQRPSIDKKKSRMPEYPWMELRGAEVAGTVHLVLRHDRQGNILDVDAEKVNLHVVGGEVQMQRWRKHLANACVDAARHWKIIVPDGALAANETVGIGRVPITFMGEDQRPTPYGDWEAYVPGPVAVIPWLNDTPLADSSPDALPPGDLYDADSGRRLRTPLGGS